MVKKKEITLDDLSEQIANLAKHTDHQIDDLAAMTMRGFSDMQDQMDKRFAEVDKKFAEVNYELKKQRAEISALRVEVREIKNSIAAVNHRLDSLEKMVKEDIAAMGDEIVSLKKRIKKLEQNYLRLKSAD